MALGKLVVIGVTDNPVTTATKSGCHSGKIDPANRVASMDIHKIVEAMGLGELVRTGERLIKIKTIVSG